jgi:protein-L-isoaspartate(D-aspartate) O-methyltransferase
MMIRFRQFHILFNNINSIPVISQNVKPTLPATACSIFSPFVLMDKPKADRNPMTHDFRLARERMIREQLKPRGITDSGVLKAMAKIQRHLFVEEALGAESYNDHPLPIGHKQTISQPYIVALMTQELALTSKERVLEIGTGSGYQTAVLAEIAKLVCTVERIGPLIEKAKVLLAEMGYSNIFFKTDDGTMGWPDFAPYQAIMVTAGAPSLPEPLLAQLAVGGRMLIPIGNHLSQDLIKLVKTKSGYKEENLGGCRFVDLVGKKGWGEEV